VLKLVRSAGISIVTSITLVTAVSIALPWRAIAQTEPDNDNDAYDQQTCTGVFEDELEGLEAHVTAKPGGQEDMTDESSRNGGNDPDAYSPFPNGSFQFPFELGAGSGGGQTFSFQPTYTSEEDRRVEGVLYDEPQISVQPASATVAQGEEGAATVLYDSFAADGQTGQDFYTVAFVDGKFLNGYMAGGSAEALAQLNSGGGARADCGAVSRSTKSDSDGDGMDDNWEIRYGLNPNNPGDAGQDPDSDGYVANAFPNLVGEFLNPAPPIAGAKLGDGSFTNYEEYVLDTNPNLPDTDGDGFSDEMDAVGLGQTVITFPGTKALGEPAYLIHVIVVGITGQSNEEAKQLVKVDSATREIQAGTREKLQVELNLDQAAAPGETLVVSANPTGSQQRDLLDTFRWSVDGTLVTASSGQGRRTLEYPIEQGVPVGTTLAISLDVINFETGQLAKGALSVVVGDTILLDFDPTQVEPGGTVDVHALLTSHEPASSYLFNWSLDGKLAPGLSGVGVDTIAVPIDVRVGDQIVVQLDLYRTTDSALIGSTKGSLTALDPIVTIVVTPLQPQAGQNVVVEAVAEHFGASTLVYSFVIDGTPITSSGPTVTIPSVSVGSHSITVAVRSAEPPAESASAQADFSVSTAASLLTSRNSTPLASLMSAPVMSVTAAIGLAAVLLLLVHFGKSNLLTHG